MRGLEKILGLDLAGSPKRKTGYAYWEEGKLKVGVLYTDEEILELASRFSLVMIDAPLSIPAGRKSLHERGPHFRECDLLLRKHGHRFFPVTLGPMRMLTERAMRLAESLRKGGAQVFETFPGALYDILGLDRKDRVAILGFYMSLPLKLERRGYSQDELDAIACWLAGVCYLTDRSLSFSGGDGEIVVATRECISSALSLDKK
ncbi:MAG: DUF429 domain-containing protein [Aquificaceae bacterium]|uniref:DUF429 domain-containing protein n=1 Tax=Hydrogenobacter sp. Uz 6-8 TaxID=3384828 RepID=UPI0030A89772